ncbi:hypothetical protein PI124_g9409 [Phytophthora idaei]|nr:hypothetical protein PI124_g9409 [Phytophthora idaei]
MQDAKTSQYGLVATSRVEAGEVLGEYLGQLRFVPKKTSLRARNQSYMLRMRARSVLEEYVGIDARQLGGRMRFANHSCSANARLFELANGCRHTVVVVVTTQAISPGDEVTVNYGQDLWSSKGREEVIDEVSSVFVPSEDELEEENCPPPGQCQTPRPAPGPPGTPPAPTVALLTTADLPTVAENPGEVEESSRASQGSVCADTFDGYDSIGTLPPFSLSDDEEPTNDEVEVKRLPSYRQRRLEERRVEREVAEERRREDRTEARQHIQDMLMMLAALQDGTMPGVRL